MSTIVNYFLHANSEYLKYFLKENPIIFTKLTEKIYTYHSGQPFKNDVFYSLSNSPYKLNIIY